MENNDFLIIAKEVVKQYLEKNKETASLKAHTKGVWTCDFHPTKNELVSGGNDNTVILWDVSSAKPIKTLSGHSNAIYDVQFSEDGKLFGSCSNML